MTESSERFRREAAAFTEVVAAVPPDRWSRPTPCEGWVALDVVRHLVEWLPGTAVLLGAFDVDTGPVPPVESDPLGAWTPVRDAIERGPDDPGEAVLRTRKMRNIGAGGAGGAGGARRAGLVRAHHADGVVELEPGRGAGRRGVVPGPASGARLTHPPVLHQSFLI